jgi:hypothetical protein
MKKINLFCIVLLFPTLTFSQVFNTASTLKPLKFSLGLEPCVLENNFGLFLHGGVGIKSGIDFAMKYGILEGSDYFGADLEWRLLGGGKPNVSLVTGGHTLWGVFGLDLGLNLSFPITKGVGLYTGLDTDVNFPPDDVDLDAWIPVGVEISMRNSMSFILEAEIPLDGYFVFGGGIAFYF